MPPSISTGVHSCRDDERVARAGLPTLLGPRCGETMSMGWCTVASTCSLRSRSMRASLHRPQRGHWHRLSVPVWARMGRCPAPRHSGSLTRQLTELALPFSVSGSDRTGTCPAKQDRLLPLRDSTAAALLVARWWLGGGGVRYSVARGPANLALSSEDHFRGQPGQSSVMGTPKYCDPKYCDLRDYDATHWQAYSGFRSRPEPVGES